MESKGAPTALRRAQSVLAIALLVTLPALSHAGITVLIDGAAYPAQLRENTKLLKRLNGTTALRARHFEGELDGVGDSWIRVSIIRDRWNGVVSLDGARFVIDASVRRANSGELVLDAQSPKTLMTHARCAADDTAAPLSPDVGARNLASLLGIEAEPANFAVVCQSTVDGACLLAELDIVFDQQFQQRYPSTYQVQAAALLNMLDGYFRNDMKIQFDVLSMNFPTTELFTATTDANELLNDITAKKNAGQIPFVVNPRAIFHVVTGRRFNSSTVGLANTGTLCAAASNTGTTQVVSNNIALTALVVAHEIGHNFGATHDGSNNTCGSGFIMAATLSQGATHFSSCSIDSMTARLNALPNLAMCFEYPVDAVLAARPDNPTTTRANENFTLHYDVSEDHASVAAAELYVTGRFAGGTGTFVDAKVNGIACTVAPDAQTYRCATSSSGGLLDVTARVNGSGALTVAS
ncbi:MAG TPA: M12 family metallo-peptidase, partial [Pseudomonadales bacterium]